MRKLAQRAYSILALLMAGTVIFAAVSLSVARLLLPLASDYRPEVEREVSRLLGQNIRISVLRAEWKGLGPRLILDGVRLYDATGQRVALRFEQASVEVDIFKSVWNANFVPRQVTVSGVDLDVTRRTDKGIYVRGLNIAQAQETQAGGLFSALNKISFDLKNGRIRWRDEIRQTEYFFDDVNVLVALGDERLRLAGALRLPRAIGQRLHVVLDIHGHLWEPAGWSGRIYEKFEDVDLSALPANSVVKDLNILAGRANFESWSVWSSGRMMQAIGQLDVRDFELSGGKAKTAQATLKPAFDALSAKVQWQAHEKGWRLDINDLSITQQAQVWPRSGLSLDYSAGEHAWGMRLGVDYARLHALVPLAMTRPELPSRWREVLHRLEPAGEVWDFDLRLSVAREGPPWLSASGDFQDIAVKPWPARKLPGISGLDGRFSMSSDAGELLLDSQAIAVDYPTLFKEVLYANAAQGAIHWTRLEGHWQVQARQLELENDDLQVLGRFDLDLNGGRPFMDLRLGYANGNGAHARRYLPSILPAKAHAWLDQALVDGHVTQGGLIFFGHFADFPFRGGQGVFETRFDVVDARLDYFKDWPVLTDLAGEVVFRDESMWADVEAGRFYNYHINDARVRIDDLKHGVLEVRGRGEGGAADVLRYLRNSALGRGREAVIDRMRVTGRARTGIALRLPLKADFKEGLSVQGDIRFKRAGLNFPALDVGLQEIDGTLGFTHEGISAEGISARFHDDPVRVMVSRAAGGPAVIDLSGSIASRALLAGVDPAKARRVNGHSDWTAVISVPFGEEEDTPSPELYLYSGLRGVEVDFPTPFGKTREAERSFVLKTNLDLSGPQFINIRYGSQVAAAIEATRDEGQTQIKRAEIRFNQGAAKLPPAGIWVAGRLERFALSDWRALHEDIAQEDMPRGFMDRLQRVNLSLDSLELYGREFTGVRISANKKDRYWSTLIDTSLMSGLVALPLDLDSGLPVALDLEYLNLDSGVDNSAASPIDPASLPPIRLTSKHFILDGKDFHDLRLETTPLRDGIQIHNLRVSSDFMQAHAYGDWRMLGPGREQTDLRFDAKSENVGGALTHLGFETGLLKGKGEMTASMRWPDAPMRFAWKGVDGKAHIKIEGGRLTEVDPGAGRILGLINLQTLPRRLIFDFSDLFTEGFSFDKMEGNFAFADSDAFTSDTQINGPAAKIKIKGRTGMNARDYDQEIIVTPEVRSTLPVAGALVGGPTVGVAVFVVERLFSDLGESINEAAQVRYRVTGNWDDPQIENLKPPQTAVDESEGDGFE